MTGRFMRLLASSLMLHAALPGGLLAETSPASVGQQAPAQPYNTEQLDALLAPIALYPDELLTQILIASTFPLDVVAAARWAEDPAHKSLTGDALAKALEPLPWDPSVKSLVPFPVVLAMMNGNLEWMQQLGYAFATQQADVFASVQRLRVQAQANGKLQSTSQQVVRAEEQAIIIEPAQSGVVYVPSYNPTEVYGAWPYPAYPPVYLPPPPGYAFGTALATGLAFGAGIAITAGLWGWARPAWRGGYANINVNRYNAINVNRTAITSNRWRAAYAGGRPANFPRAPGGPVGAPARGAGLPAGAIGRPQVGVPGGAVRPPTRAAGAGGVVAGGAAGVAGVGGGRAAGAAGVGAGRAAGAAGVGAGRAAGVGGARAAAPGAGQAGNRPGGGGQRAVQRPAGGGQRGGGAFADLGNGRQASQYGQRGAQSRSVGQAQRSARGGGLGGGARAGGGGARAGDGGARAGGGGGRGGGGGHGRR